MIGGLHGAEDQAVHHLERRRHDAAGDDAGHRLAGRVDRVEDGEERPVGLRDARQPQRRPGDDAERPLAPDDQPDQVVAGPLLHRATECDDLAVGKHELDAEDVVGGDAVLERVRTAGVLGDVAPDGTRGLARRVRGIEQSVGAHGVRDPLVHHAGLGDDATIGAVDRLDAIQPAGADHHRRSDRQRASREPGAGATRNEGRPSRSRGARRRPPPARVFAAGRRCRGSLARACIRRTRTPRASRGDR